MRVNVRVEGIRFRDRDEREKKTIDVMPDDATFTATVVQQLLWSSTTYVSIRTEWSHWQTLHRSNGVGFNLFCSCFLMMLNRRRTACVESSSILQLFIILRWSRCTGKLPSLTLK